MAAVKSNLPVAVLTRYTTGDSGTYGKLTCGEFSCFTGELPWRGNRRSISCIPPGTYTVRYIRSPRFGFVYGLRGVPGRSNVLIHRGNYSGDTSKGFKSNVEGCILLGKRVGKLRGQTAVLSSVVAVNEFMQYMENQDFILVVEESYA